MHTNNYRKINIRTRASKVTLREQDVFTRHSENIAGMSGIFVEHIRDAEGTILPSEILTKRRNKLHF